jgi:FtsP/CotA-like multicopper oxidase with cupredoxin domain
MKGPSRDVFFCFLVFWTYSLQQPQHVTLALPSGFTETTLFDGTRMTDMVWLSNENMLVTLKEGIVNLHVPGNDYEYREKTLALDISQNTCTETERGLGSIQLHPNFETNHYIYLYYTFPKFGNCDRENPNNGPINRLSRWTFDPTTNTIDASSEYVLLDTASTRKTHHNSGKIEFGNDGLLYVSIGDLGASIEAQQVNSLAGSIVRLTDAGDIPPDNPFAQDAQGVRCHLTGRASDGKKCQELYAIGLRNPWRFTMDPHTTNKVRFFVNDVGAATWEEISQGGTDWENATDWNWQHGIQNFGWAVREGPCKRDETTCANGWNGGYIHPFHFYIHEGGGAVTAGTFVPSGIWPSEYDNKYLYADYVFGKMYLLTHDSEPDCLDCNPAVSYNTVEEFTSFPKIITMKFGPYHGGQQALYYTTGGSSGDMRRIVYTDAHQQTTPPPTPLPTTSPIPPPLRPGALGEYPGALFPWKSGNECSNGHDFCGIIEFCMNQDSPDAQLSYGYRLPCFTQECECPSGPGPLIRLIPGNVYQITLRNTGNEPTNLHTHGLHIVGDGNGDDVTRDVPGGGNCLDYTWNITSDHPGGTHWYHAHRHTLSEKQLGGGAFGMLIVEDNTNVNPVLPSWANHERLMQVHVSERSILTNGRQNEIFGIASNQWYRFRVSIVDADAVPYNLVFDDQNICDIHKVASDGVWRGTVPGPKSSVWELTGASRADFAIRCNNTNGEVPIFYRRDELVARIRVGSWENSPYRMEEWKPNRPDSLKDMLSEIVPEANKFSVKLGFDYINNDETRWDPLVPLATIAYNQVHEWTLVDTVLHPFHLHLYHMQIATPNGCGPAYEEGEFYDTISAPGDCTVRFRTADIGQRCVLHCHVLYHEDNGSMSWVNVTGDGMPMNNVQSPSYSCPDITSLVNNE